ncbi:MAG TPA: thymidine kinase [Patescibacteria group bacterium]|nr:thymidine kinase [Patescibacteria group bacterium]
MVTLPFLTSNQGSLTFFTGPMCCGKTLELVRHLHIFREQRIPMTCLRPSMDTRTEKVQSRSGLLYDGVAVPADDLLAIERAMIGKAVIGIDELQFFPIGLVSILESELRKGKTILVSGLDTDFRGQLFPTAAALMALPETIVQRLRAVCSVCHQYNATRTQRLRNGKPVPVDDPRVVVEESQDDITYEARCLEHHEIDRCLLFKDIEEIKHEPVRFGN